MRMRLATVLIAVNVFLATLAVASVAIVSAVLLNELALARAQERVLQTAQIAEQALMQSLADAGEGARLLAERPTLTRFIATDDQAAAEAFLARFVATSGLDGALVQRNGALFATTNAALPIPALGLVSAEQGLLVSAAAPFPAQPTLSVTTWRLLDARYAAELQQTIGLEVAVLSTQQALSDPRFAPVYREAAQTGAPVVSRQAQAFLALRPLAEGGAVAVLMPTDEAMASLRTLISGLLGIALLVGGIVALINLFVGRALGRPLRRLTKAAARIGGGDLLTPVPAADGYEAAMLASTLEDMRLRLRQLTSDLQQQQIEAQAILAGIVEGVFTVDRDRRIRYLNPQAAALFGLSTDEALGRFCGDVLRPRLIDGRRPCEDRCPIVHARARGGARATEHLDTAAGRRTVVITSSGFAEQGQVQVIRDETEIEAARRLRDSILATISHEFRTPLSAQLASLELLLDQLATLQPAQVRQLLESLQRGSLRLTHLIDNLLESARIEAGYLTIRSHHVALDMVVEDALALTQPLLNQRHQLVEVDLPHPLPLVMGDASRLTQVMVNLLANASKFAPQDSLIRVGGVVEQGFVVLWVDDEGPGWPNHDPLVLFGQFYRADEPEQSGIGLGLWIVKSIVERHGGTVAAVALPVGARLALRLPVVADA